MVRSVRNVLALCGVNMIDPIKAAAINTSLQNYNLMIERRRIDEAAAKRKEEVRKIDERQDYDRVQKARRLGLDRGQNFDGLA